MSYLQHRNPALGGTILFLLIISVSLLILTPGESRAGGFDFPGEFQSDIVDGIDVGELRRIVGELAGVDTIYFGPTPFTIATRFAYSAPKVLATEYLVREIELLGYEPRLQRFLMRINQPALSGIVSVHEGTTLYAGDYRNGTIYRARASEGWADFVKIGSVGEKINDLAAGPLETIWAACGLATGGMGALFSSNDGIHWTRRDPIMNVRNLLTVTFSGRYGVAAGLLRTVLRTADGGSSWTAVSPSMFGVNALFGSSASGETHFWLVSQGGYLYESTDAGVTWTEHQLTYRQLLDIDFSGSLHGVAVGNGAVFYTKDGGASWNEVVVPVEFRSVKMADTLRVVAGGARGEVYSSENGGIDWSGIDASCPGNDNMLDMTFTGRDTVWIAGGNKIRRFDLATPTAPECAQHTVSDTIWGENVIFDLVGKENPNHKIVLSAHYDSQSREPYVRAPGADDNASGTASVLECARALKDAWTESTVEFVLFDGEEVGLRGSRHFVALADPSDLECVINLDMLGYDQNSDMSMVLSGQAHRPDSLIAETVMKAVDSLGLEVVPRFLTGQSNLISDQVPFWNAGIPGLLFIEGSRSELTPFYHTIADLPRTLDFDYMAECARAAAATVAVLAGYRKLEPAPEHAALSQNFPNPFSSTTRISFVLPRPMDVELVVYNVSGRGVSNVYSGFSASAEIEWDGTDNAGRNLASGVYFMRLVAGSDESVRKIVIVR